MLSRILIIAALVQATAAQAATAGPRQPTGQWVVNFDAAQCFAARNYGTVDKPLYLVIKAPPLGDVMQVAVMRKGSQARPEQQRGSVQFDDLEPTRISLLDYKQADSRLRTFLINVPSEKFASARDASSIRILTSGLREQFALTSMAALLKTMDECVSDLRRVWNVSDPAGAPSPLKGRAKGNLSGLFNSEDYPTQALLAGDTGTVVVAILVDEQGKVADCSIVATSGAPVLDAQTCAALTARATFRPAVGPDGKPAKDAYLQRITWRLR